MMNEMIKVSQDNLYDRIVDILETARVNVVRSVNSQMVVAYWLIGREIVEEEQSGKARARYGKQVITQLSRRLTTRYGKGFSTTNLGYFRQFYLTFQSRVPEIRHPVGGESEEIKKLHPAGGGSAQGFHPGLSWSHYRALMKVDSERTRVFYEIEASKGSWSKRQLERQIHSLFYERLLKSQDKAGMLAMTEEVQPNEHPIDIIKDPYVLEFLDLPESHRLIESELETALISRLQEFLLELGSGFAFIGRQRRLTLDGDHFYPDLVFYHINLRCYVIIDLKTAKLTHGDLGQMQMYVNYYDREIRSSDENPAVGLILCAEKNDSVVRYVLGDENRQIFASRYKLELPSEEELKIELQRERRLLESQISTERDR